MKRFGVRSYVGVIFLLCAASASETATVTAILPRPRDFNVVPGMTAELRACATRSAAEHPGSVKVPVESGPLSGSNVSVASGLTPGGTIVVAGVHHLHREMKVRVLNQAKE